MTLTKKLCSHWPTIRVVSRWIWFAIVATFVVAYIRRNSDVIAATLTEVTPTILIFTAGVTVLGKATLSAQCGSITTQLGHRFRPTQVFWMYTASDMAKYVPGGIWNAVTRIKMYADAGMAKSAAGRAFALEKYWQVLGALATGAIALGPSISRLIATGSRSINFIFAVVITAIWTGLCWVGANRITKSRVKPQLVLRSMIEQVGMALFLGLGLWIPFTAISANISLPDAIGAFSIGRGLGYVAVFAPAGIGVREVVTLWALGKGVEVDLALVALGVNRVMTFVADLGSFAAGLALKRRSSPHQPSTSSTHGALRE